MVTGMTINDKKQWLDRARKTHNEAEAIKIKLQTLEAARNLSELHSPAQEEIDSMQEAYLRSIIKECCCLMEIIKAIEAADMSPEHASILICKYVEYLTLKECSEQLRYSLGHTARLHGQALRALADPALYAEV